MEVEAASHGSPPDLQAEDFGFHVTFRNESIEMGEGQAYASNMHLPHFSFSDIEEATGAFEDKSVLGSGSFGCVYRGSLPQFGLDAIAVKTFRSLSEVGLAEHGGEEEEDRSGDSAFDLELHALLAAGQHPCIVQLLGTSIDGPRKCLVTTQMTGGSLEARLGLEGMRPPLTWMQRLTAVRDTCKALLYLHNLVGKTHHNVHPSKILFNGDLSSAVLTGFGCTMALARTRSGGGVGGGRAAALDLDASAARGDSGGDPEFQLVDGPSRGRQESVYHGFDDPGLEKAASATVTTEQPAPLERAPTKKKRFGWRKWLPNKGGKGDTMSPSSMKGAEDAYKTLVGGRSFTAEAGTSAGFFASDRQTLLQLNSIRRTASALTTYSSPELQRASYDDQENAKADVYALGVTGLSILTGQTAEEGDSGKSLIESMKMPLVVFGKASAGDEGQYGGTLSPAKEEALAVLLRQNDPLMAKISSPDASRDLWRVCAMCISPHPDARPSVADILSTVDGLKVAEIDFALTQRLRAAVEGGGGANDSKFQQRGRANPKVADKLGIAERANWASAGQQGAAAKTLFELDPAQSEAVAEEYRVIALEFSRELPFCIIDRIDRIENGAQHEAFHLKLSALTDSVGSAFDRGTMVRMLYHGATSEAIAKIVAQGSDGFLPMLAGTRTGAIYGDGTYFAKGSAYAHRYATTMNSYSDQFSLGYHTGKRMIVSEVVLGRSTRGRKGLKSPALEGDFESFVDDVADPSIFVVQHANQIRPAYVITYHSGAEEER